MQKTSEIYKELLDAQQQGDPDVKYQTRLAIGEPGVLITKQGDSITFGSKAYAKTAAGSTIKLTETEERPLKGLKIFGKTEQNTTTGKNLLDLENSVAGYIISETGTVTSYAGFKHTRLNPLAVGVYTFSVQTVQTGTASRVHIYDANGNWVRQAGLVSNSGSLTFNIEEGEYGVKISTVAENYILQIEAGTTATAYEPYTGGIPSPNPDYPQELNSVGDDGSVNVTVCGKNLLNNKHVGAAPVTDNGITFTTHADGSVTVNGTATATARLYLKTYADPSIMDYSGMILNGASSNVRIVIQGDGSTGYKVYADNRSGDSVISDITITAMYQIMVEVSNGTTVNNVTVYPMIRLASFVDSTYEPYNGQTLPISTPNGLPGIPVTSGGNYTDSNGQQWICDEVDFEKGVYVQRIGKWVFDNSNGWKLMDLANGKKGFSYTPTISVKAPSGAWVKANALCSNFEIITGDRTWVSEKTAMSVSTAGLFVMCHNEMKKTLTALEEHFANNPMTFICELATPIETALSAEQLSAFAQLHSNYPSTTVFNDSGAYMEIAYIMNGDGTSRILTGASGADSGYDETLLISMETDSRVFSENTPDVGACISSQIDVEMIKPFAELPKQARLVPYVRLTDGIRHSEWIQKGVFYIDTRAKVEDGSSIEKIVLHGYDDMLKAEQDYPASTLAWPAKDVDVVREIAEFIGVSIDYRTIPMINRGYTIQYPTGYSCRDVLGYIAAMYAGCFIMSDLGDLRLVTIYGIPKETRYLIEANGYAITFGGERILV